MASNSWVKRNGFRYKAALTLRNPTRAITERDRQSLLRFFDRFINCGLHLMKDPGTFIPLYLIPPFPYSPIPLFPFNFFTGIITNSINSSEGLTRNIYSANRPQATVLRSAMVMIG